MYAIYKWWKKIWQQKYIKKHIPLQKPNTKTQNENPRRRLKMEHNKIECVFTNTTPVHKILHLKSDYILMKKTQTLLCETH